MFGAVVRALCVFLSCSTVQCTGAQQTVLFSEQINDEDYVSAIQLVNKVVCVCDND